MMQNVALAVGCCSFAMGRIIHLFTLWLPKYLQQNWQQECQNFLGLPTTLKNKKIKYFTLHRKFFFNKRYFVISFITTLLSVIVTLHFGATKQLIFALTFTWILMTLAIIDMDEQILPDIIVLPLLWLGMLLSLTSWFSSPEHSIIGASLAYTSLWSFTKIFYWITGKTGMGHGDFKFFAALGAWFGFINLPLIILIASFLGASVGFTQCLLKNQSLNKPFSFGPYLAIAGWVTLIWGNTLNSFI